MPYKPRVEVPARLSGLSLAQANRWAAAYFGRLNSRGRCSGCSRARLHPAPLAHVDGHAQAGSSSGSLEGGPLGIGEAEAALAPLVLDGRAPAPRGGPVDRRVRPGSGVAGAFMHPVMACLEPALPLPEHVVTFVAHRGCSGKTTTGSRAAMSAHIGHSP